MIYSTDMCFFVSQDLVDRLGVFVRPHACPNNSRSKIKYHNVILPETNSPAFNELMPAAQQEYYVLEMLLEVMFNGIPGEQYGGVKLASLDLQNARKKIITDQAIYFKRFNADSSVTTRL